MIRSLPLIVLALMPAADAAHAQHARWNPDDRILITSFQYARGIATDGQLVFVATTNGLEVYDQTFQRWLAPSTIEDGYPVLDQPVALAYDARERNVWLLTQLQTVYSWSPVMQRWEQRFVSDVPADVRAQLLARNTAESDPAWRVMRTFAGRDAQGRNWPVTGLVAAERPGTYWGSTWGGNFSFVDTRNLSAQPFIFGTIAAGVSAIALSADGFLYFGSDGRGQRHGVTRADTTLQQWEHAEPRIAEGVRRRIYALLPVGDDVFVASDDGLYVIRNRTWQRISDEETRALALAGGRVWAGTRGTLGYVTDGDDYVRVALPVQSVQALATRGDTLYVAGQNGIYRVIGDSPELVVATQPVFDLAWSGDVLVVVTRAGLHTLDGSRLSPPVRHASLQSIGGAVSVQAFGPRVFIGGRQGLAEWIPGTGAWRHLTMPDDVPEGPVYDVLEENGRLWLATPAGALRLTWN